MHNEQPQASNKAHRACGVVAWYLSANVLHRNQEACPRKLRTEEGPLTPPISTKSPSAKFQVATQLGTHRLRPS